MICKNIKSHYIGKTIDLKRCIHRIGESAYEKINFHQNHMDLYGNMEIILICQTKNGKQSQYQLQKRKDY